VKEGASVTTIDDDGATILHTLYSAKCGQCKPEDRLASARLFIDNGALVNATDDFGSTPLHSAALGQVSDPKAAIEELVSLGARKSVEAG